MTRARWLFPILVFAIVLAVAALIRYHAEEHKLGFSGSPLPLYLCTGLVGIGSGTTTFFGYTGTKRALLAIAVGLVAAVAALFTLHGVLWLAFGSM